MPPKVEKITEPLLLGEGPHWSCERQCLYLVSISERTLHKYVPATGLHTRTALDGRVGFVVPVAGSPDEFVVGLERSLALVRWGGAEGAPAPALRALADLTGEPPADRINDGKCDPRGRVFAGTMGKEDPPGSFARGRGSLYRLDPAGAAGAGAAGAAVAGAAEGAGAARLADGIGISNGLAWDVANKAFYYIDSLERNIRRYDYDVETGHVSNMRYIFDFEANKLDGLPDGMTIDTDGRLWVAVFNGACVAQIDPQSGKLLQKVPIPAAQVTSVTFGGPALDVLFVTTARQPGFGPLTPACGCTYMVTGLGVKGHPNVSAQL